MDLFDQPLFVLFAVASIGYLIGRIRVAGVSLGVAAVLFVGLAAGALAPQAALPELLQQFGLLLFVYTVGLSSGPGFFRSLRKRGLSSALVVLVSIASAALLASLLGRAFGWSSLEVAGLFAGALTNTPALAAVLDASHSADSAVPVVAYSLAYPLGVILLLLVIHVGRRVAQSDSELRPSLVDDLGLEPVVTRTARVQHDALAGDIHNDPAFKITLARIKRGDRVFVVEDQVQLRVGDLVSIVGHKRDVERCAEKLGELTDEHLELDRSILDFRRMFLSNPRVSATKLRKLALPERYGAVITRVRRGDVDLVATPDLELELGDRVRVVAPREKMHEVEVLFGDSYRRLAEVDIITFGIGIAAGLLLARVPIPIPGLTSVKLGLAGGPLVVGLVLGRLGRTGSFVWNLPYAANLTLRQLGLVLFLAGVGTRSGGALVETIRTGGTHTFAVIAVGALLTTVTALFTAILCVRYLKMPWAATAGFVSGTHTQPAALAFAVEQEQNEIPNGGYASAFPIATIVKILFAQLLYAWLSS